MKLGTVRPTRLLALTAAVLVAALLPPMGPAHAEGVVTLTLVSAPVPTPSGAESQVRYVVRASEDSYSLAVTATVTGPSLVTGFTVGDRYCYAAQPCDAYLPAGVDVPVTLAFETHAGQTTVALAVLTTELSPVAVAAAPTVVLEGLSRAPVLSLSGPSAPVAPGAEAVLPAALSGLPESSYAAARLLRRPAAGGDWVLDQNVSLVVPLLSTPDPYPPTPPTVHPTESSVYVLETAADADTLAARSPEVTVLVAAPAALTVSPVRVPPGSTVTVSLGADPLLYGGTYVLERQVGTRWTRLRAGALGAARVSVALKLPAQGTSAFRARLTGTVRAVPPAATLLANTVVTLRGIGSARSYAFVAGSRSRPARWNPCKPITYRTNLGTAPAWVLGDVKEALRRISLASGLTFRYGGRSKVVIQQYPRGSVYRPGGPQEFVIGWYTHRQVTFGPALGFASVANQGNRIIGYGVAIDRGILTNYVQGFGAGRTHGAVLLHELGHMVGLGHVAPTSQIMTPVDDGGLTAATYGAGDLAGLKKKLGRAAGCL